MSARKRRLKQLAKRVPGIQPARRRVLRRARSSAAMRTLVKKVFAVEATSLTPLDVTAGKVLGGVGAESLPVTIVVMLNADAETVDRAVDEIAHLQLTLAGFRPVIVTDRPAFAAVRRYGYPAELLVPRDRWDSTEQGMSWDDYARRRIGLLFSTYRATTSVTIGPGGLDASSRLMLRSLRSFQ